MGATKRNEDVFRFHIYFKTALPTGKRCVKSSITFEIGALSPNSQETGRI
jgi:hypothetical protein